MLPSYVAAAGSDELAGEQEPLKKIEAKPSPVEAEGSGQISLTKTTRTQAPSFELPEAVVTGSGEHKASSSRPDLSVALDTSGGIKANPGEASASKDQLGSVGPRQSLGGLTETPKPAYGQVRALYGLANTFDAGAFWGQEFRRAYYLLEGEGAFSDGGPPQVPGLFTANQNSSSGLFARGGWRQEGGPQWSAELAARWRDRLWTRNPLPAPDLSRTLYGANLAYEGSPQASLRHTVKLSVGQAQALLPGAGTAYTEQLLGATVDLEKEVLTVWKRILFSSSMYAQNLNLNQGLRNDWLTGVWLMTRIEPWSGAQLGLGVSLDCATDQPDDILVAPRFEFEQRLGTNASAWLRFTPRLELPTLQGAQGLFEKDTVFPAAKVTASKDLVRLEGGLSTSLKGNIDLELKGFVRQNKDAIQWDDPAGVGLWSAGNVAGMRSAGATLSESAPLSPGRALKEHASLSWQGSELLDSPGLGATFFPAWKSEAGLDWAQGPWKVSLNALYLAERQGRLAGGDLIPAYVDLRLNMEYAYNDHLSFLAEARNILAQPVQEFSGYADPSPFVGLGAAYQF
jgi:hypothetical protein